MVGGDVVVARVGRHVWHLAQKALLEAAPLVPGQAPIPLGLGLCCKEDRIRMREIFSIKRFTELTVEAFSSRPSSDRRHLGVGDGGGVHRRRHRRRLLLRRSPGKRR